VARIQYKDGNEPERRSALAWGLSALIALGFVAGALVVASPAQAASFGVAAATSDGSSVDAISVGATIDLTILLMTDVPEPPQAFELVLDWGLFGSRAPATRLGTLSLVAPPSGLDPSASVSLGADCLSGVSNTLGPCTIDLEYTTPLHVGTTPVVAASFLYDWAPPEGFEICFGLGSDPTCTIEANEREWISVSIIQADGTSSIFAQIETGTLAGLGLRPIPEPSLAVMLGLGLAGLAAFRPGAARDTRPTTHAD